MQFNNILHDIIDEIHQNFVWQTASNVLLFVRNIINNINNIISDINGTEQLCHKPGDLFVMSGCLF